MKKLLMIIVILSFISCDEDELHHKKIFNPADLSKLSLNNIDNFWINDSIKHVSDFIDGIFNTHAEFIDGISYSGSKKMIAVSVFNSQDGAIEAMKERINNVAMMIVTGEDHALFSEQWWYGDGISSAVFVNQWNTIIETVHFHSDYEQVKTVLINTAAEIAKRIDSLSN